ncbi:hypothetical protein PRZ48_005195 [Zasmidium cellare]|uniref:Uncharacterized protein n=1 Tax=Zasmidium cellare TaxID=395010 RepID=A0ABR0ERR9_ZASCE|nr:hypothetical protein PRZ48_005195 [Zasmidium cellare]
MSNLNGVQEEGPPGSDYLNRNMLMDDSEPPAYTPQPQKPFVRRAQRQSNGARFDSRAHAVDQDHSIENRPPTPIPSQPAVPAPAPAVQPAHAPAHENPPNPPASSSVRKNRMVIAIDFGTTYSDWTTRMSNLEKVPSVISYTRPRHGEAQWGTDISEGAVTMVNQKLELELQDSRLDELDLTLYVLKGADYLSFDHVREAGPDPEFTFNTPEEVVTDYLRRLFGCMRQSINEEQISRTDTAIDLVVTVPVPWTYHGYNSMFKAVSKAGFNTKNLPTLKDIIMVSEPEAAALFTAQDLKDQGTDFLQDDHCFILCDAGGGTVDAVAYQVKKVKPLLELERATEPTGCKRGSAFIDTEFKLWLRDEVLGRDLYAELDPVNAHQKRISPHTAETDAMRQLIKRFSSNKVVFSNHSRASIKIDLPPPLESLDHGRVNQGELTITWQAALTLSLMLWLIYFRDEMKKLMDECVSPVVELILAQIEEASRLKGRRIKNVFLVGGFGASPYLQEELQESLDIMHKKLRRPDAAKSLTAVVQGGVIFGCEKARHKDVSYMRAATRSYGVLIGSRRRFHWLIKKGDLIISNQALPFESRTFWEPAPGRDQEHTLSLYSCDNEADDKGDDLPEDWHTGQHEVQLSGTIDMNWAADHAQLRPSHNPATVLEVVTNAAPAELEARRAAIVAGRVIESHEYTPEPCHNEATPNPPSHNPNHYQPIERWNAPRADGTNDRSRHKASAESIRELRWLIREKYRLDVYVWSKRGVQKAMRPIILRAAKKSDALLLTILAIVKTWLEDLFDAEEWRLARKIKEGIIKSEGQYVLWKDSPPWDPKRLETGDEMMDDE